MTDLVISDETNKLIDDMGVTVLHYEGTVCSCVGANHGMPDPRDDCVSGFRHRDPVEYRVLRTSINFKRLTEKAGAILQGGCQLSIPRWQLSHHAVVTGNKDLSAGIDLSSYCNIKIAMDRGTPQIVNCALKAADDTDVSISEIVYSINSAGLGEIAYESGADGDPDGSNYLSIFSQTFGGDSRIDLLPPTIKDATGRLLGITTLPARYARSTAKAQYIPLYDKISRGDIVVLNGRTRRDGTICKRGTLDRVKAFNITRIISVFALGVEYREHIDFTFSGQIVTWLGGKGPATGASYTVEFLGKPNYQVYEELPMDRGSDTDIIAKRVLMQLRNYEEDGVTKDLPIDRLAGFSNGFSNGFKL